MMIIENYQARTANKIPAGEHTIEIDTTIARPGGEGQVVISVDGAQAANAKLARTVPVAFTATESFDIGEDLGSPVSDFYARKKKEERPFAFDGKIKTVKITQP